MGKRLYRSRTDKVFGGVCGGLANYFNIDVVIVRIIFVASALVWGLSFILYLVLWVAVPPEPVKFEISPEVTSFSSEEEKTGSEPVKSKKSREIFAIVLIVLGIFITLDNMFVWFTGRLYFPIILILLGLLILLYSGRKENNAETGQ
jgi:phage shock protein PspC (stress-responsive transcriptional regulator)